uniref:EGF-like domain-containing protein n=1 Tax=Parascaris univalens TaxID=6257 RepID=A0A915A9J2_PARUN
MQIFFTVRFIVLLAQVAALFLLIIISRLCGITPFRELLSKAHAKCGSTLREADVIISGLNVHYSIVRPTSTAKSISSIFEQLKRVANDDSNSTSASLADELDMFNARILLEMDPVLNSTGLGWDETAGVDSLETIDSINMESVAHRREAAAPSNYYDGEVEGTNATANATGNEGTLYPLKRLNIRSFSCIAVSYADIWHMDLGIPYSQINAPILIAFEIVFTLFSTGATLISGTTQSTFIMFVLTLIFITEIFCWNCLFLRCKLRRSFGEYDLVNAGIREGGMVYNSTVTAISLKHFRSATTTSATE